MVVTLKRIAWTLLRVWLGAQWLEAGMHKLGAAAWTGESAGAAVAGFAKRALGMAAGDNPSVQGWYAAFLEGVVLPNAKLFSFMVAWGEVLVGVGLILGAFTGFAALGGALMNLNFMLAGTSGVNPILYTAAVLVVAGIAHAQYYAVDALLRPKVERTAGAVIKKARRRPAGSAA